VIPLGAAAYSLYQLRKPSNHLGRWLLRDMNRRHSELTDWGLSQVYVGTELAILDVGRGGGRTLEKLAALAPSAHVVGIDHATGSVAESEAHNRALIADGRIEVKRASVDHIPEPDGRFDLATAIETHYYWPDLVGGFREIRRVLRQGGTLIVIAEAYRDARLGWLTATVLAPIGGRVLTSDEHRRSSRLSTCSAIGDRLTRSCTGGGRPTVPGSAGSGGFMSGRSQAAADATA
jgi:SAM-dependent methyltransferase